MLDAGFRQVRAFNPYWNRSARSVEDPGGYRVVIQPAAWPAANQESS
jgi:prolyl oligopeptidase